MTFLRDYLTGLALLLIVVPLAVFVALVTVLAFLLWGAELTGRAFWVAAQQAYHDARAR